MPAMLRGEGATRSLPCGYTPGESLTVSISIDPPPGTLAAGLEDSPPGGWTVSTISNGGVFDSSTGKVKWGPFFAPSIPSVVTYDVKPPGAATGEHCFSGAVSFDGLNQSITGELCISECVDDCGCDCDDGNECTDDTFVPGGCVHTPVGDAELIVVEMPELTGHYLFNAREAEVSLGFALFEIGCAAIEWAGRIHTSTVDCSGDLGGFGGTLEASFVGQPLPRATYSEILGEPSSWLPFDRADVFAGGTFDFLLDGNATVRVFFEQVIQDCFVVEPASAILDSVGLIIAARRMHDYDGDGRVYLDDANEFSACMSGPGGDPGSSECRVFDSDRDNDVDVADAAAFQQAFTGP